MPDNKKVAWLVLVGSVLLIMWLRRSGDNHNELQKWLKSNGLSEFEDPLKRAGQLVHEPASQLFINKHNYLFTTYNTHHYLPSS